ncbi:MAG TPA: DUF4115 domain-containing protein [Nitrospinota bacterium]|nr:DUF4115 domain-containing protein [Nitrospinota bacterium]
MAETLGQFLVERREEKGLTVEEIASITHLRPRFIVCAENDKLDELPSKPFTIGLLRAYAETVGISPVVLIERYESLTVSSMKATPNETIIPLHDATTKKFIYTLSFAVVIVLIAVGLYISKPFAEVQVEFTEKPSLPIKKTDTNTNLKPADSGQINEKSVAFIDSDKLNGKSVLSTEVAVTKAAVKQPTLPAALSTNHKIKIVAIEDTWIRAIIDGQTNEELVLKHGQAIVLEATLGFVLSIGNVAGTEVYYNEKRVKLTQPTSNVLVDIRLPELAPKFENPQLSMKVKEKN